jgi:hypothetical protein
LALGKSTRPYVKNKLNQKRAGGMTQVAKYLPSKCKALSSNPSTPKKQKKKISHGGWIADKG